MMCNSNAAILLNMLQCCHLRLKSTSLSWQDAPWEFLAACSRPCFLIVEVSGLCSADLYSKVMSIYQNYNICACPSEFPTLHLFTGDTILVEPYSSRTSRLDLDGIEPVQSAFLDGGDVHWHACGLGILKDIREIFSGARINDLSLRKWMPPSQSSVTRWTLFVFVFVAMVKPAVIQSNDRNRMLASVIAQVGLGTI